MIMSTAYQSLKMTPLYYLGLIDTLIFDHEYLSNIWLCVLLRHLKASCPLFFKVFFEVLKLWKLLIFIIIVQL